MDYRGNIELVQDQCKKVVSSFIRIANGRYREHMSDKFLEIYLNKSFMEEYLKYIKKDGTPGTAIENIAYSSSVYLFEIILEKGCGIVGNGHHQAQKFASLFI